MKTESGHRLYLKKKLARKIEAEAKILGVTLDEMILIKLNSNHNSSEQKSVENLARRTQKIETILLQLIKLIESGLIDSGYVRGAIESQIESQASEDAITRAESLEIRRSNLITQIRQEIEQSP